MFFLFSYKMNSVFLAEYYLRNKHEFMQENGHEKLLIGLKKHMMPIESNLPIVAIDVGSCVGDYIPHLQKICPESNTRILCFEPNPVNILQLEPKIQKEQEKNIKLFKHCVSNENTTAGLYDWMYSRENVPGNGNAGLRSGGLKIRDVEVKTLDNVLSSEFGEEDIIIKFIKIDTEGNDGNVLKGFERFLPKTNYIIFECSNCLDDFRGPGIANPMKDIVDFLSKHGFDTYRIGTKKLFKVNDEYWHPIYEQVKFWSNCFALKKGDAFIHKLVDDQFDYTF